MGQQTIRRFISVASLIAAIVARFRDFALALLATLLFYLPSLKHGSHNAGFLFTGDVLGFYWPSLMKIHNLISSFNFTAIDFSLFNGSSDFFLTPNLFGVHPLFVLYSLVTSPESMSFWKMGRLLVVVLAFHSFVACYFSLKLLTRFYSLEFGTAFFAAVTFAFSQFVVSALGEPMFVFCASIVPWCAYAALSFEEQPSARRLLLACLPVLIGYLGGYIPLGIACLALSVVLVAAKILLLNDAEKSLRERSQRLMMSMAPFICASLIAAPYLVAVYLFFKDSPGAKSPSLFYSAHQMAELPQNLLSLLSFRYESLGPVYEFNVSWGFVAIAIMALFLLSPKSFDALSPRGWKILKLSVVIYFATLLSIYGQFSVMSDLVYYLIPQVGKMHIYQRFLLPVQLLFGVMIALMLKSLVKTRPMVPLRIALIGLALATITSAYIVSRNPALSQAMGINNYIVFELFLGFLLVLALMFPGETFAYVIALILISLPALDRMYDFSVGENVLQEQQKRKVVALDKEARKRLVAYLRRFNDKELIKYVDLTPMWWDQIWGVETFPKSFPYFVLKDLRLSSYHGFAFYLAAREDYMRKMPVRGDKVELYPDWQWVIDTGADFLVASSSALQREDVKAVVGDVKDADIYRLPNDAVIIPLNNRVDTKTTSGIQTFDNGYFRAYSYQPNDSARSLKNIALHKVARQSSTSGGEAHRAVDGNTSGLFDAGSVTHTGPDANAWFEIDLGSVESIDSVKVWNRTDCCGERLRDYWVFISDRPFGQRDTASSLRARPRTWSKFGFTPYPVSTIKTPGVQGRYIRIQLGGGQPIAESFLSLAEVEVFRAEASQSTWPAPQADARDVKIIAFTTNNANYLRLDLEATGPATVEYLLWANPRLSYFLNGQRIKPVKRDSAPLAINVPSGRNTIEIRYRNWPLTVFWIFYALYGIAFVWALVMEFIRARKSLIHSMNSAQIR